MAFLGFNIKNKQFCFIMAIGQNISVVLCHVIVNVWQTVGSIKEGRKTTRFGELVYFRYLS